jgi:hypothetical protein
MNYVPQLGEKTGKVIGALLEQAMDGFLLASRTGLNETELSEALKFLQGIDLVKVDGCTDPGSIRSSYFHVPPSAKGTARLALQNLMARSPAP